MTKFALAVVAIAFGALMVAGCPTANNAANKANTPPANNATTTNTANNAG